MKKKIGDLTVKEILDIHKKYVVEHKINQPMSRCEKCPILTRFRYCVYYTNLWNLHDEYMNTEIEIQEGNK